MDIMAMDMANKINKSLLVCAVILSSQINAAEWEFEPYVGASETFSDNIMLNGIAPESSFVTKADAGLRVDYTSKLLNGKFSGSKSFLNYSHDSELNNDYRALNAEGSYSLWQDGPKLVANANIQNVSRNEASNSFGDLLSGDTVETQYYSTGIIYDIGNSHYTINSSLMANSVAYEDEIGESSGYTATIKSANGKASRNVFWDFSAKYSDRQQGSYSNSTEDTDRGEQYIVDAKVGWINAMPLNPFIRYYDEELSGFEEGKALDTVSSWGPGLRWKAGNHLIIDLSYNFVENDSTSDDYVATHISWQPSERTSLIADYNERFFGKSYYVDFSHRTKRLTNKISYNETIEIYERSNYEEVTSDFWCPSDGFNGNPDDCFPVNQPPSNPGDYDLIPISELVPVDSSEYSLNKRLKWSSMLNFSRTSFTFNIASNIRERIESGDIDDYFDTSLSATRTLGARSNLVVSGSFRHTIFDKENPDGPRQEDYYRTISSTYSLQVLASLNSSFTLRYINRSSSIDVYTYDEVRATLNITKDF